ncbi:MAG: DUF2555 domain-containing protein [Synechococcales cyanobacterium RM1_1_8]|nr:DUF2555 domain-containing protein [Synechococcales cyanobacterium RM1_1_8]
MATFSISQEKLAGFTPETVAKLAERLEEDDYPSAFESLEDWQILRAIAFQRPELVKPYIHLLDLQSFDES